MHLPKRLRRSSVPQQTILAPRSPETSDPSASIPASPTTLCFLERTLATHPARWQMRILNLIAEPFQLSRNHAQAIYDQTSSPGMEKVGARLDVQQLSSFPKLRAYGLAAPVGTGDLPFARRKNEGLVAWMVGWRSMLTTLVGWTDRGHERQSEVRARLLASSRFSFRRCVVVCQPLRLGLTLFPVTRASTAGSYELDGHAQTLQAMFIERREQNEVRKDIGVDEGRDQRRLRTAHSLPAGSTFSFCLPPVPSRFLSEPGALAYSPEQAFC